MKFTNKRALVVGTGKSGVAAVNLLNHVGAQVTRLREMLRFRQKK